MTAIADALRRAGHLPARERLQALAAKAVATHPRNWDAAKAAFFDRVRDDAAMLWEMLEPYRDEAAQKLLAVAAREQRATQDPPASTSVSEGRAGHRGRDNHSSDARPAPPPTAGMSAVGAVARISVLDTFRVNGRPIGDTTAREASAWAGARERDARFVRMLTANLPPDDPIRKWRTSDEATALYERAETNDE